MTASFEGLLALDERLAAAGHHPLTPFWRPTLERFYGHPTARTLVGRVGRGGAKSHTSAKVALNETLFGDWAVPPGERHFWAFVSRSKDEATQRLLLLESFLRALGVRFETRGDEIAILDSRRGFRVFACQVGAVSGFRCFGYSADELAKWNVEGVNPSAEVCASLSAMCITHPGARRLLISSPLGHSDYHAQRFERGDAADQTTIHAPSWLANPDGITEQATHDAEPDARTWKREYAAIPQGDATGAFDPVAVGRAIGRVVTAESAYQPIGLVDLSSGRGDAAAFGVAGWVVPFVDNREIARYAPGPWIPTMISTVIDGKTLRFPSPTEGYRDVARDASGNPIESAEYQRARRPKLVFHHVDAIEGRFSGSISGSELVSRIAATFRHYGVTDVIGDQREEFFARSEFQRHRLQFHSIAWNNSNKIEAVTRLNRLFAEDAIALPDREKLKRELLNYSERITPSGTLAYSGRGHDDEASLLITCALAELERLMPGSTLYAPTQRTVVSGR